jgi:S1-C subfamily serine protease
MRFVHALVALVALLAAPIGSAQTPAGSGVPGIEQRLALRSVDRATVRIIAIGGAEMAYFDSRETRVRRMFAEPRASFGTGFFIDANGLVLTAAHVIRGADILAIVLTGTDTPVPARVVYVDEYRDIAIVHAAVSPPALVPLPRNVRVLQVAERLSGTGFPVSVRERYPAAFVGVLSRENTDGSLQSAMSLNPGNSGGPVMDESGTLIGIVSRRGEPRAGIEGIALLEPVRFILPAVERAKRSVATSPPTYAAFEAHVARVLADFVGTSEDRPYWEQTSVATLDAAAATPGSSSAALIIGLHAWNMHIALLESRSAGETSALEGIDRALGDHLREMAMRLVSAALIDAPYLRVRWPAARDLHVGGALSYVIREGGQQAPPLRPSQPAAAR